MKRYIMVNFRNRFQNSDHKSNDQYEWVPHSTTPVTVYLIYGNKISFRFLYKTDLIIKSIRIQVILNRKVRQIKIHKGETPHHLTVTTVWRAFERRHNVGGGGRSTSDPNLQTLNAWVIKLLPYGRIINWKRHPYVLAIISYCYLKGIVIGANPCPELASL